MAKSVVANMHLSQLRDRMKRSSRKRAVSAVGKPNHAHDHEAKEAPIAQANYPKLSVLTEALARSVETLPELGYSRDHAVITRRVRAELEKHLADFTVEEVVLLSWVFESHYVADIDYENCGWFAPRKVVQFILDALGDFVANARPSTFRCVLARAAFVTKPRYKYHMVTMTSAKEKVNTESSMGHQDYDGNTFGDATWLSSFTSAQKSPESTSS